MIHIGFYIFVHFQILGILEFAISGEAISILEDSGVSVENSWNFRKSSNNNKNKKKNIQ